MRHQGERLAFQVEPRHDRLGIHASFDQLEDHAAAYRRGLFREPHLANSDLLQ